MTGAPGSIFFLCLDILWLHAISCLPNPDVTFLLAFWMVPLTVVSSVHL